MFKTTSKFVAAAMVATLPTLAAAEGLAVSLSASLDAEDGPTSVSVAAAFGDFAVASSVATAASSGAASGASDSTDLTPTASVRYNDDANAYETTVTFVPAPVEEAADVDDELDCDAVFADFNSETPTGAFGEDVLAECESQL